MLQPGLPGKFAGWLERIQNDLLDVGADLSVPDAAADAAAQSAEGTSADAAPRTRLRVTGEYTAWLERACDEVNATLEPLRSFVIPGGTPAAAQLHVCRTVCRRAERRAIAVEDGNPEVVRYLNRLSDLLFILSRATNTSATDAGAAEQKRSEAGQERSESLWDPGTHRASPAR